MTESSRFIGSLEMFQTADQACSGLALARTGGHGGSARYAMFDLHAADENKGLCAAHRRILGELSTF